jgi:hypothetical protein
MKTFDLIQTTISYHSKDPHSKSLKPDCRSPLFAITTQSLEGRCGRGVKGFIAFVLIKGFVVYKGKE